MLEKLEIFVEIVVGRCLVGIFLMELVIEKWVDVELVTFIKVHEATGGE